MKKQTVIRKDAVVDLLREVVNCFSKQEDYWWCHKDNDGSWIEVSEDLNAFLEEAVEMLGLVVRDH